ncbi:unnamed protein product [Caenorhabditis auriculariae]|uniref:Uncharacterized protein n=1 Tax=Caenorhabditis auriculariae TaxID=2777116 RepID=A0A8S1HIP4_9PELO|nr:unnamed protein product [Caenorhabditis auriculariae]
MTLVQSTVVFLALLALVNADTFKVKPADLKKSRQAILDDLKMSYHLKYALVHLLDELENACVDRNEIENCGIETDPGHLGHHEIECHANDTCQPYQSTSHCSSYASPHHCTNDWCIVKDNKGEYSCVQVLFDHDLSRQRKCDTVGAEWTDVRTLEELKFVLGQAQYHRHDFTNLNIREARVWVDKHKSYREYDYVPRTATLLSKPKRKSDCRQMIMRETDEPLAVGAFIDTDCKKGCGEAFATFCRRPIKRDQIWTRRSDQELRKDEDENGRGAKRQSTPSEKQRFHTRSG